MSDLNNLILNRVFTKNTIKSFIEDRPDLCYYAVVKRYINDITDKNHGQIISEIYQELDSAYRNEYFYKNTLLNKLLLGVHSPTTTTALIEVPIDKSKADFIMINGRAMVYEIKTELDTFERLSSQLKSYYKAFPNVNVVTSEDNLSLLEKKLKNTDVGIYLLTKRKNTLKCIKTHSSNFSNLNHKTIFKILRKQEFINILNTAVGEIPKVSDFDFYNECYKQFLKIDIIDAYNLFTRELKKRNKISVKLIKSIPPELRGVMYFSKFKEKDYAKLNKFLDEKIGENYVLSLS